MRVAVNQRFLPHYRLGFYRETLARLSEIGWDLRLFYSYPLGAVPEQPWATSVPAFKASLQVGDLSEAAVFAPSLFSRLRSYRPDLVVLEDISNLPTSLIGVLYCRLMGIRYLVWGLGIVPKRKSSRLRKLLGPLIRYFYRHSAGFICYSRWAQDVYRPFGRPTYLAPNAYLAPPEGPAVAEIRAKIDQRSGRVPFRILSIGELKAQKRIDELLRALALLKDLPFLLELIGDGPELPALKGLAKRLEIDDRVFFHGAIFDHATKRGLIQECVLGVVPGRGGLVIQEMMYYGIPVICGPADGTEVDRIVPGVNGILLQAPVSVEDLAAAIRSFLEAPPQVKREWGHAALDTVLEGYNIHSMAAGFVKALQDQITV